MRLVCSDGITGIGEATTIGGLAYGEQSPEGIKSAIDAYIAPLLAGHGRDRVNVAMQRVAASVQGNSFAKSAVETALLDAQGQRLGLPVHALLGGAMRDALPVLWTLASGDATRDVDEALRADRGPPPQRLQAQDRQPLRWRTTSPMCRPFAAAWAMT